MKKSLLQFLFIVSMSGIAFAQTVKIDSLDLKQAVNLTLQNQPLILQVEQEMKAVEAGIKEQKTSYLPVVDAEGSYTFLAPISKMAFGGETFDLFPASNYNINVGARYKIYDFGKRDADLLVKESYKLTTEEKQNQIKSDLSYAVIQLFYKVLFLQKSITVKDDQIAILKKHIDDTEKRVETGSATDFDILTTKVRVSNLESQKIDIQDEIRKAKIALCRLMGVEYSPDIKITGKVNYTTINVSADSLIAEAYVNRPEIKAANDTKHTLELKKDAVSYEEKPVLNALATFGFKNGLFPNMDVLRGNWVLGVNASIPIFDGNKKEIHNELAETQIKETDFQIESLKRKIRAEVQTAVSELKTAEEKIQTTQLNIDQAEQALERAQLRYDSGVATNIDVLDAESQLSSAKLENLRVVFRNILSLYSLKQSVGENIWEEIQ